MSRIVPRPESICNLKEETGLIPGSDNAEMSSMVEYLGHLGFMVMAMAYWVKDILLLRIIAIVGFSTLIFFNYHMGQEPNWIAVCWNAFFIAINSFQVLVMLYQRKNLVLSEKEKELHERLFSELSEFEFAKLIRIANWKRVPQGSQLIHHGQTMDNLFLIYHGKVNVGSGGSHITTLADGQFIGEMSFFSQRPASADVEAKTDCDLCIWGQEELRGLLHRNPSLFMSIQGHLGKQLSEAVHTTNQAVAG